MRQQVEVELLRLIENGPPLGLFVPRPGPVRERRRPAGRVPRSAQRSGPLFASGGGYDRRGHQADCTTASGNRTNDRGRAASRPLGRQRFRGELGALPPSVDTEAAWLLSRAALQLDQPERADRMLALAGDFGTTRAALPGACAFRRFTAVW